MAKKNNKEQEFNALILLDRSGSMQGATWIETVYSINNYVSELKKAGVKNATITVVAFDSEFPFQIMRDAVSLDNYVNINTEEVQPRGMTPLYDATGKAIFKLLSLGANKNALIIITDGLENTSRTFTQVGIKEMITEFQTQGNEVIFLGANFDAKQYTETLGMKASSYVNTTNATRGFAMGAMATKSAAYAKGAGGMAFTADEQTTFEDKKTNTKV